MDAGEKLRAMLDEPEAPYINQFTKAEYLSKRVRVNLPLDKNGNPVDVGDRIYLRHNGKTRTVTSLVLHKDDSWIVCCDSGGCFMLPESQDNIMVIDELGMNYDRI